MYDEHGRNGVQSTIGRFKLELPRILPAFERTEPRTSHHWRDALQQRRMARKGRRLHMKLMAQKGALMLDKIVESHRNGEHRPKGLLN